jgi:hypothetical protein
VERPQRGNLEKGEDAGWKEEGDGEDLDVLRQRSIYGCTQNRLMRRLRSWWLSRRREERWLWMGSGQWRWSKGGGVWVAASNGDLDLVKLI